MLSHICSVRNASSLYLLLEYFLFLSIFSHLCKLKSSKLSKITVITVFDMSKKSPGCRDYIILLFFMSYTFRWDWKKSISQKQIFDDGLLYKFLLVSVGRKFTNFWNFIHTKICFRRLVSLVRDFIRNTEFEKKFLWILAYMPKLGQRINPKLG